MNQLSEKHDVFTHLSAEELDANKNNSLNMLSKTGSHYRQWFNANVLTNPHIDKNIIDDLYKKATNKKVLAISPFITKKEYEERFPMYSHFHHENDFTVSLQGVSVCFSSNPSLQTVIDAAVMGTNRLKAYLLRKLTVIVTTQAIILEITNNILYYDKVYCNSCSSKVRERATCDDCVYRSYFGKNQYACICKIKDCRNCEENLISMTKKSIRGLMSGIVDLSMQFRKQQMIEIAMSYVSKK